MRSSPDASRLPRPALSRLRAPVLDHGREQRPVLGGATGVRLALIPDRALDRERNQRGDHAVVELRLPLVFALVALGYHQR